MKDYSILNEEQAYAEIAKLNERISTIKQAIITINDIVPFAVFESSYGCNMPQDLYILLPASEGKLHLSGNNRKIDYMWLDNDGKPWTRDEMLELMHRLKATKTNMTLGIVQHESV